MPIPRWLVHLATSLTLARSFQVVRGRMGWALVASTTVLYAFGSMVLGGMLVFARNPGVTHPYTYVFPTGYSSQWWNFPAVEVVAPGGTLILPFFATVAMMLVSLGVGVGMSVGMILTYRVLRDRRRGLTGASAASTAAGLTPAMVALVTLGACCSTTAAATAGIGVLAQSTGTTVDQVLYNTWYLGVFQMLVLGVALLAQEQLLTVFRGLLPRTGEELAPSTRWTTRRSWKLRLPPLLLRVAVLVGAVTWSLEMFAEWTLPASAGIGPGSWVFWVFEQQALAIFGIALAFSSSRPSSLAPRTWEAPLGRTVRLALLACGVLLLSWVPPSLAAWGVHGLINELLWGAGLGASSGAVPAAGFSGAWLLLRWGLQYLLLGALAIMFALRPRVVLKFLNPGVDPAASATPFEVGTASVSGEVEGAAPTPMDPTAEAAGDLAF